MKTIGRKMPTTYEYLINQCLVSCVSQINNVRRINVTTLVTHVRGVAVIIHDQYSAFKDVDISSDTLWGYQCHADYFNIWGGGGGICYSTDCSSHSVE